MRRGTEFLHGFIVGAAFVIAVGLCFALVMFSR